MCDVVLGENHMGDFSTIFDHSFGLANSDRCMKTRISGFDWLTSITQWSLFSFPCLALPQLVQLHRSLSSLATALSNDLVNQTSSIHHLQFLSFTLIIGTQLVQAASPALVSASGPQHFTIWVAKGQEMCIRVWFFPEFPTQGKEKSGHFIYI